MAPAAARAPATARRRAGPAGATTQRTDRVRARTIAAALLPLILAVSPIADAQAPPPTPSPAPAAEQQAKAVITLFDGRPVPASWRQGFSVPLSAARSSAGAKPRSVVWYVEPPEYDQYSVRRDDGRSIDIQTGVEPVTLRVRLAVAKGDTFDESVAEIKVGEPRPPPPRPPPTPGPQPDPNPPPTPPPSPVPTDPFGRLAYSYGQAVTATYAETLDESASMLAAGVSRAAITSDFEKRWKARRDQAFKAIAAEYAKLAPDDREPTADEKAKLAQAWRDFARGMRNR